VYFQIRAEIPNFNWTHNQSQFIDFSNISRIFPIKIYAQLRRGVILGTYPGFPHKLPKMILLFIYHKDGIGAKSNTINVAAGRSFGSPPPIKIQ